MSSTAPGLTFLSWYRRGLAAGISPVGTAPQLDVALPAMAKLPVTVGITGVPSTSFDAHLHSPGEIIGFDTRQVIRTDPAPGAVNVETSYFPLVEFARPDLPWMLTPNVPQRSGISDKDPRSGLRPWLVLVVLPADTGAIVSPAADTSGARSPLPYLKTTDAQLPDLAESWLWAHVQVLTTGDPNETIDGVIRSDPNRVLSRIISPRRLRPNTPYLACLVPAFDAGRDGGLGLVPTGATLGPAWHSGQGDVRLPVYFSWSFSTGPGGDFESLARLMKPFASSGAGLRSLDVGHTGVGMPGPGAHDPPWLLSYEGVLVGANVTPGAWDASVPEATFKSALAMRLDGLPGELAPTIYGASQAGFRRGLAAGDGPAWMRALNLDPRYRAVAALGTAVVQRFQESLMASAWDQAGDIRGANRLLARGQLAREASYRLYQKRIGSTAPSAPLGDERLLQITGAVHAQIPAPVTGGTGTVANAVGQNPSLQASLSSSFRRITRLSGPLLQRTSLKPLPSPVTAIAAGTVAITPPLVPVSGQVSVEALSQTETLAAITPDRVTTPIFPWELASQAAPRSRQKSAAAPSKSLPPPSSPFGFMSDVLITTDEPWAVVSEASTWVGRAMDFSGAPQLGWERLSASVANSVAGQVPGNGYLIGSTYIDFAGTNGLATFSLEPWGSGAISGFLGFYSWFPAFPLDSHVQQGGYAALGPDPNSFDMGPNILSIAVAATDLTGTGRIDVIFVWSQGDPTHAVHMIVGRGLTPTGTGFEGAPFVAGWSDVQTIGPETGWLSATATGTQLCVLSGSQLHVVTLDATGNITGSVASDDFAQQIPYDYITGTIAAAIFGQSGMDMVFAFSAGAGPALHAGYRVALDIRPDGTVGTWGDPLPLPIPGGPNMKVMLGAMTAASAALRKQQTQAFRDSASVTQTRQQRVLVTAGPPSPPATVAIGPLADQIRTALDPNATVPSSVLSRLQLPNPIDAATVADVLQPVVSSPRFPQPMYETFRDLYGDRLMPDASSIPDNCATLVVEDPKVIEAFLIGLSTEISRSLLWHGFPGDHSATFFNRFWDARDATGAPIAGMTEISRWDPTSDLGTHAPPGSAGPLMLLIRGELLRRAPHVTIYAAPALTSGTGRSLDVAGRVDPIFTGRLKPDFAYFAFALDAGQVRGDGGTPGWYIVFQEHPTAPRFGLKEPPRNNTAFGGSPTQWRDLEWSAVVASQAKYDALSYITAATSPIAGLILTDSGAGVQHRFGFSAAHMAHITFQPAVQVAIHGSLLLPPKGV